MPVQVVESALIVLNCQVFLHMDEEGDETCWWRFHNKDNLKN